MPANQNYYQKKRKILKNKIPKMGIFCASWSHHRGLNPRPHPYHGCALPTELWRHERIIKIFPKSKFFQNKIPKRRNYFASFLRARPAKKLIQITKINTMSAINGIVKKSKTITPVVCTHEDSGSAEQLAGRISCAFKIHFWTCIV